jgi:hypothetical protein
VNSETAKPRALLNTRSFARLAGLNEHALYSAVQNREIIPQFYSDSAYLFSPEFLEENLLKISHRVSARDFAMALERVRKFVAGQAAGPVT